MFQRVSVLVLPCLLWLTSVSTVLTSAANLKLTITPDRIMIGSGQPEVTRINCSVDDTSSIKVIHRMSITHACKQLVFIEQMRKPKLESADSGNKVIRHDGDMLLGNIWVEFKTRKMTYKEAGEYECQMSYFGTDEESYHIISNTAILLIEVGATCGPGSGKITNHKTSLIAMSIVSAVALVVCLLIIVRQRILLQRRSGGDNAASTSQRQTNPGVHLENNSSYMISSDLRSDDSHIYTACGEENTPPRALTTENTSPRALATENTPPRAFTTENAPPRVVATEITPTRALATENTSPRAFTTEHTSPRAGADENVREADRAPSRVGADDNSQMFEDYERLQENGECHTYEELRAYTLRSKLVE